MEIKESGLEVSSINEVSPKISLVEEFGRQGEAKKLEIKQEQSLLDKSFESLANETLQEVILVAYKNLDTSKQFKIDQENSKENLVENEPDDKPLYKLRVEKNERIEALGYKFMRDAEGGFSDNPHDRGGRTNKGCTQETYNNFRDQWGEKRRDVKDITDQESKRIYNNYWRSIKGDELPPRTAVQMCDFGYNSGSGTAVKELQGLLKDSGIEVKCDGKLGPKTLEAVDKYVEQNGDRQLARDLNERRLEYLRNLKDWKHFGEGWSNRCNKLRQWIDSETFGN